MYIFILRIGNVIYYFFLKYKIGNIVGDNQFSLKTNATRIYIVQYTTRCVNTLIIVIQTITKSDK